MEEDAARLCQEREADEATQVRTSEVTPVNLIDEPKEPRTGRRRAETSLVPWHVDASRSLPLTIRHKSVFSFFDMRLVCMNLYDCT